MEMSKKFEITFSSKNNQKIKELNQILDKISVQKEITSRELNFLDNFEIINDDELKDYNFLSLQDLFYLMCRIKKTIICDIKDKNGRINEEILSIDYNHDECKILLGLKHSKFTLTDNFLYKLIYEFKHDNYSLDTQDEYYEKIEIEK